MKLNPNQKTSLFIFFLFIIFSILMLWPLPLSMTNRLFSPVDPLLNTWIIAWDVHQLLTDPLNLFQANIFFPLTNTLAFSEHLFVLSLIAMPVILVSGNPLLAYNFIQLISFILSGYVVYLLVYHLTKNRMAGLIAGIIFAFHPYRFRQLGHIQNIAVFWTPLTFLCLHKFLKKAKFKYMFLFALFFILQALSCGYMGVFLSIAVGLAICYYLLFIPKKTKFLLIKRIAVCIVIIALFIGPFLYPYIQVKKEHQFRRNIQANIRISANLIGYATISRFNENVFYHRLSRNLRKILYETNKDKLRPVGRALFPGIIALLLALTGCFGWLSSPLSIKKRISNHKRQKEKNVFLAVDRLSNWLIFLTVLIMTVIIITGGLTLTVFGIRLSMPYLTYPVYFLLFLFMIKLILSRYKLHDLNQKFREQIIDRNFYLFLGFIAFTFSLGPKIYFIHHDFGNGPYMILYRCLFFFEGIRVPERFGIIVMLAISVLAGYGIAKIFRLFNKKINIALCLLVSLLLLYEYICIPLPSTKISREPDEVYKWLAQDERQYAILEYPFDTFQENKYYMYYSTFHWKRLANGSSGFSSSYFIKLRRFAHDEKNFPNQKFIDYLKSYVPVKYLVLHLADFSNTEKKEILNNALRFSKDLILVKEFNQSDYIYEVNYTSRLE